jgi:two-component system OmpR family response regulator
VGESGRGPRVLVVDDDDMIRDMLATTLRYAGYDPASAADGPAALAAIARSRPDLVVLDVLMPGLDGLEVCRRLRAQGDDVPVVFLTARATGRDLLEGFARGADDYVTKPFVLEELLARIRAVLARAGRTPDPGVLRHGDLVLDESAHTVRRGDRAIDLTPTEFTLLRYLMLNAGRVVSKNQILDRVWRYDFGGDGHVVETCLSSLRRKIDDPAHPSLVRTVRGVGYSLPQPGAAGAGP